MIRSSLTFIFCALWIFNGFSQAQDSLPDADLQRRALEESKVREEVLKKYRVGDDTQDISESETQDEIATDTTDTIDTTDTSEITNNTSDSAKDLDQKLEQDKGSFLSGLMPNMSGSMSDLMKGAMKDFLKENPLSKLSPEEIKSMIMVQVTGKPMEQVFKKNPKFLDFVVEWLRDKKALPSLIGILNKQKELKQYGIAFFVVFILSFIFNLMSKGSLLKRIFKKLLITLTAISLNLGIFYWFFREELSPTIDIVLKYV